MRRAIIAIAIAAAGCQGAEAPDVIELEMAHGGDCRPLADGDALEEVQVEGQFVSSIFLAGLRAR